MKIVFRKKNWSHPRANRGRINLKVDSAVDLAESLGVRSGSDQNCQAKNRIVVKSGSPVTPYSHLEGNFNSGTDSKNSSNSPEVGGPFLLLRAIPSSEPFNGKQFDSHAIEHLFEVAG